MNKFLQASRPEFKVFVDRICSIPSERPSQAVSASYATPIQILGRLPPTSREGFPSLPFLIDSAKSFASLISLWLQKRPNNIDAKLEKDHALRKFHELCTEIRQRTQDCLNSAESAERPTGGWEPEWERLLEERELHSTFHGKLASRPLSPPGRAIVGVSRTDLAAKRHSNGPLLRTASSPSTTHIRNEQEPDTPRSSASTIGEQNRPTPFRPRPKETIESTSSSKNSSTVSLEVGESSRVRSNTASRDASKHRFKEFVSGSARRRMREETQAPWPSERNEF